MNKVCDENITLKYFAGQLAQNELASAEEHIANCPQCCQTIAELTKSMFSQETAEEKAFLDSYAPKSQEKVSKLIKQSLETINNPSNNPSNSNIVSLPTKTDTKKNIFSYLKMPYLVLAASLAILVLFGGAIFFVLHNSSNSASPNSASQIAQSISNLREINLQGRPTIFRLEGFDYAEPGKGRSQNVVEIKAKLNKTEDMLKTEIDNNPTDEKLNLLAQTFIMSEKYNEAIETLEKAILLNPNNPALFTNLAVAYCAKSDYQNALTAINKALAINENYLVGIFNRALIYQEIKQYDNARSEWEKYLTLDGSSPWASEVKQKLSIIKQ